MSIKLARLLPATSTVLSVILLEWGRHSRPPVVFDTVWIATPTLICYGINAPAFKISRMLAQMLSSLPPAFFSEYSYSVDIMFVLVVAVLWHLIGRRFDRFESVGASLEPLRGRKIVWKSLVVLYGINLLIVICLHNVVFTNPRNNSYVDNNYLGELIYDVLWLFWSLILIVVPSRDLLIAIRRRKETQTLFASDSTATPR